MMHRSINRLRCLRVTPCAAATTVYERKTPIPYKARHAVRGNEVIDPEILL